MIRFMSTSLVVLVLLASGAGAPAFARPVAQGGDPACLDPFTSIPAIQGSGATTPISGTVTTTQGVVVGDYEGASPELGGFYLQALSADGDPLTSDGLFIFNSPSSSVSLGQVVRVTGTATEFRSQTQLGSVTAILDCGEASAPAPVDVTLPVPDGTFLERYEGMLVRLPQTLTVTEHFQLGRAGQVTLAPARLRAPTDAAAPGAAAQAVQTANALNQIVLDDGQNLQNPDPILFGRGGLPLSAANTLRAGDTVQDVVGVLTFGQAGFSTSPATWRLRPIGALGGSIPSFVAANPRPTTAPVPAGATLRVAAAIVLNYLG